MKTNENSQIFFITSNQSKLDNLLTYKSKIPLNIKLTKKQKYKREEFIVKVFSF